MFLTEYNFSESQLNTLSNGGTVNSSENVTITQINNFDASLFLRCGHPQPIMDHIIDNGDGTLTITWVVPPCSCSSTSTGTSGGPSSDGDSSNVGNDAPDATDNTSDTTTDNNTSTGTGAGTEFGENTEEDYGTLPDDYNDAIVTAPNVDFSQLPHTKALSQLTKSAKVNAKVSYLIPRVLTQGEEDGAQYDLTGTNPITYSEVLPFDTSYNTTSFPSLRDNTTLVVHMHPKYAILPDGTLKQLSPVFSDADIDAFLADFTEQNNDTDFTSVLVSEAGVFALRITDSERAAEVNTK